uniref:Uncharacterized protein n=1 Tax=Cannabis sativa TaxID=3483 RepID=A0A803PQY0_CANSA
MWWSSSRIMKFLKSAAFDRCQDLMLPCLDVAPMDEIGISIDERNQASIPCEDAVMKDVQLREREEEKRNWKMQSVIIIN